MSKVKAAVVEVEGDGRGVGYLIDRAWVATCAHLVETVAKADVFLAGRSDGIPADVAERDPSSDWALLHLPEAVEGVEPLAVAPRGYSPPSGTPFVTHVFLPRKPPATLIKGEVRVSDTTLIQLSSDDLSSGMGSPSHGFSGAPILIAGRIVVGHVKNHHEELGSAPEPDASQDVHDVAELLDARLGGRTELGFVWSTRIDGLHDLIAELNKNGKPAPDPRVKKPCLVNVRIPLMTGALALAVVSLAAGTWAAFRARPQASDRPFPRLKVTVQAQDATDLRVDCAAGRSSKCSPGDPGFKFPNFDCPPFRGHDCCLRAETRHGGLSDCLEYLDNARCVGEGSCTVRPK